jgi:hypothetical protein
MTLRETVEALLVEHACGIKAEISPNGIRLINAVIGSDQGVWSIPREEYDAIWADFCFNATSMFN